MEELVSIIIPVYNAGQFIERCANSLMKQTYANCELIFVDDMSLDDSVARLESIKDKCPNITIVRQNTNGGPGMARKKGVEVAKGRYCIFVDSDDWVEKDYVKHLVEAMEVCGDFVIGGVCCDYEVVEKNHRVIFDKGVYDLSNISAVKLADVINFSYPVAKIFQTRIIRENNLMVGNITLHEDTAMVMGYLRFVQRVVFTDECDYHYVSRECLSLTRKARPSIELIAISDEMLKQWDLLLKQYNHIKASDVKQCIQRYGLGQLLQAVRAEFIGDLFSKRNVHEALRRIKQRRLDLIRLYRPKTIVIAISACVLIVLPNGVLVSGMKFMSGIYRYIRNVVARLKEK